jgi:hypothetical protein
MNGRLFIRTEELYQPFFPSPSGSGIWDWETAARVWTRASICFVFLASNESLQGVIVGEYLHSSKYKILWRILVKLFRHLGAGPLASICAFSLVLCSNCLLISAFIPSSPCQMSAIQLCLADIQESIPLARYCVLPISSVRITRGSILISVDLWD